jgi:hypothetical protein
MTERFRIIDTPAGEAPEWVRKEWQGLELPISPSQMRCEPEDNGMTMGVLGGAPAPENKYGFRVTGEVALELLAKKSPEAAAWWRRNAPHVASMELVFGEKFCELIPDNTDSPSDH